MRSVDFAGGGGGGGITGSGVASIGVAGDSDVSSGTGLDTQAAKSSTAIVAESRQILTIVPGPVST